MSDDRAHPSEPPHPSPPEAWAPLVRLARFVGAPLQRLLHLEATSGVLLLLAAAVAFALANSAWSAPFVAFWQTPLAVRLGDLTFERSLAWFVNDGLMVIFFFVVGLEIRREVHQGELSEWRRATLPAAAAIGGMLAPAAIYLALAGHAETRSGWGVPMATDIAFAVGILALLGSRVPPALRVLLLAVAVIDDLGAIVVIALFYSSGVAASGLAIALAGLVGVIAMQRLGVRSKVAYVLPALVVWAGTYASGIHPTIAGVVIGMMTPVRTWVGRESTSPAESLIETLHPWVAYGIMPIFALANAGVVLSSAPLDPAALRVVVAVSVGLVAGKPLGIFVASWLLLKTGLATLPRGIGLRHLVVLGVVAGVGFTMALFIAQLAFSDPGLLAGAKLGVLGASLVAAAVGLILGRLLLAPTKT